MWGRDANVSPIDAKRTASWKISLDDSLEPYLDLILGKGYSRREAIHAKIVCCRLMYQPELSTRSEELLT